MQSRRQFMKGAGGAAAALCFPGVSRLAGAESSWSKHGHVLVPSAGRWNDPDLYTLAEQAVDAAIAAGASYADTRITIERTELIREYTDIEHDDEWFGIGVRVFVNGYWGFMASAVFTPDEMRRLAQGAVHQARANAAGVPSDLQLVPPPPPVRRGEWTMPIKYDPFDVPKMEKIDFIRDLSEEFTRVDHKVLASGAYRFYRKQQLFVSSAGSSWRQTTYSTEMMWGLTYPDQPSLETQAYGQYYPSFGTPMGKGWEYIIESDVARRIPEYIEEAKASRFSADVDINRYDAVMSAGAVAGLANYSIGAATELDRVLGYEANASGTSYLVDPLEIAGTYKLGSPKLTVTADRSLTDGLATVKWDEDSVEPTPATLVKEGIVTDFQTSRETAPFLAPYYERNGRPVVSNGCSSSESGLFMQTQHTANLRVHPGSEELSFDDLVAGTEKGIALLSVGINGDHQCLNGTASGQIREIRKGKLGRYLGGAGVMFRAPELWKSLVAVGGPASQETFGFVRQRGQPQQTGRNSVRAVPAKFTNIGLVDLKRR